MTVLLLLKLSHLKFLFYRSNKYEDSGLILPQEFVYA